VNNVAFLCVPLQENNKKITKSEHKAVLKMCVFFVLFKNRTLILIRTEWNGKQSRKLVFY
jgi:hypothetical protein